MEHLYFVRHGQSVANSEKIIADFDSPLTKLGVSQAKETAYLLKPLFIDLIISSPMTRALQTAEIIAKELNYDRSKISILDELRERYLGQLENKEKMQDSRWYFDTSEGYGMETHQKLYERMKKAIAMVNSIAVNSTNTLIVGHAISGDMLRLVTDGKRDFSHLATYELTKNAGYFELSLR